MGFSCPLHSPYVSQTGSQRSAAQKNVDHARHFWVAIKEPWPHTHDLQVRGVLTLCGVRLSSPRCELKNQQNSTHQRHKMQHSDSQDEIEAHKTCNFFIVEPYAYAAINDSAAHHGIVYEWNLLPSKTYPHRQIHLVGGA